MTMPNRMQRTSGSRLVCMPGVMPAGSPIWNVNHTPLNFRCVTVRDFVATRYRSAFAASSPLTQFSRAANA